MPFDESFWDFYKSASPWWKKQSALPPGPERPALGVGTETTPLENIPRGGGQRALPPGPGDLIEGEATRLGAGRRALTAGTGAEALTHVSPATEAEAIRNAARRSRGLGPVGAGLLVGGGIAALLASQDRRNKPLEPEPRHPNDMPNAAERQQFQGFLNKANLTPEPGASIAPGNIKGRFTFRGGEGASGEPVFTDRPGGMTYRPGAADEAARTLRGFVESKYGPGAHYGGAASYMNDLERASGSRIGAAESMFKQYPGIDVEHLFKTLVEQPTVESQQALAGPLAELKAIDEAERTRRENAFLAQVMAKISGVDISQIPGGLSESGSKQLQNVITQKRSQETLDLARQRESRLASTPSQAAVDKRTAELVAIAGQRDRSGVQLKRMPGDVNYTVVFPNGKPHPDSAVIIRKFREQAEKDVVKQRGGNVQ